MGREVQSISLLQWLYVCCPGVNAKFNPKTDKGELRNPTDGNGNKGDTKAYKGYDGLILD